jgi:hypothetical protein
MSSRRLPFAFLLLGLCLLAGLSGCGPASRADVSGTIKLRGRAPQLPGLQIAFLAEDGSLKPASINEDGTYQVAGLPDGEVKVCFIYVPPEFQSPEGAPKGSRKLPVPGVNGLPTSTAPRSPLPNPIPQHLRDHSTSGLALQVEAGKNNVFDYDITP